MTIASRYVPGGGADMGAYRYALSRVLNAMFSRGLDVPIRDLSSGFRLYRGTVIRSQVITSRDFDVLQQIVVQAFADGWRVREIPFHYQPREHRQLERPGVQGRHGVPADVRPTLAAQELDTRRRLRRPRARQPDLSAALLAAIAVQVRDGARRGRRPGPGHRLRIEPQASLATCHLAACAPTSCSASCATLADSIVRSATASGFAIPFPDASFSCVLCSQVIEHVPRNHPFSMSCAGSFDQADAWCSERPTTRTGSGCTSRSFTASCPGATRTSTIPHYTNHELRRLMQDRGLRFEEERYILKGELIQAFRKP